MGEVTAKVVAPFTDDQVKSLNDYQVSGVMHPFTCGGCRDRLGIREGKFVNDRLLVATPAGWVCPTCDYTQDWAWAWMADETWEQYKIPGFTYGERTTEPPFDVAATDQWKAFIAELLPPGPTRDLLSEVKVVADSTATPEDYIICGDKPWVPSEPVVCAFCGTGLFRSLAASTVPQPICLACVERSTP